MILPKGYIVLPTNFGETLYININKIQALSRAMNAPAGQTILYMPGVSRIIYLPLEKVMEMIVNAQAD